MTNVSRIVALGGSIYRILRVSEAPGSSRFLRPGETGWVRLKNLDPRGSETLEFEVWRLWRLEVTNVSRIVALGGSMYRILRGLEARGGPGSNGVKVAGGSA